MTNLRKALLISTLITTALTNPAYAITSEDATALTRYDNQYFKDLANCDTNDSGASGPSTIGDHKLPATEGGSGFESPIDSTGTITKGPDTGKKVTFAKNAKFGKAFQDYYITMRWRYVRWNWDGTYSPGPENVKFYSQAPRVLVTNPDNGKSIIAVVLEAGPAPWAGAKGSPAQNGWNNNQDGTPANYTGRVSGFPPVAAKYLGYKQTENGVGTKLKYSWAPNQKATPGPLPNGSSAADGSINDSACNNTDTAANGKCAGSSAIGNKACSIALAELEKKVRESPNGCNCGGRITTYTQGSREPWCADFVSWVYKEAGAPLKGGISGWRVPGAYAAYNNSQFTQYTNTPDQKDIPQAGDLLYFDWDGGSPGPPSDHIAMVVSSDGKNIVEVGGNQSNAVSSITYKNYKNRSSSRIYGWARHK